MANWYHRPISCGKLLTGPFQTEFGVRDFQANARRGVANALVPAGQRD